jgi:peptidoglycan/xylan/chitin deacetylase (PgdA/CDA1 family)
MPPAFSPRAYRLLLAAGLEAGYAFVPVEEHETCDADRVCLLRHDVDSDPGAAATIARIEAELGVRATYFVMLRSPVYNLFARECHDLVRELTVLGHTLGLHYDPAYPPQAGRTHTEQIDVERRVLEEMFGVPVGSVAFHQPSLVPGAFEIEVRGAVKSNNLVGYQMVADPNQSEAVLAAYDSFRIGDPPKLQLLVHPMWWVGSQEERPEELWERAILANWERTQRQLLVERAYGPPRRLVLEPEVLAALDSALPR